MRPDATWQRMHLFVLAALDVGVSFALSLSSPRPITEL
jgi:hypothetical protein